MLRRAYMIKTDLLEIPIYVEVSKREFPDIVDRNCAYDIISDEIDIIYIYIYIYIYISKLKEMTLQHYMKQPRSVLRRKLDSNYIEEDYPPPDNKDFDYNFLP